MVFVFGENRKSADIDNSNDGLKFPFFFSLKISINHSIIFLRFSTNNYGLKTHYFSHIIKVHCTFLSLQYIYGTHSVRMVIKSSKINEFIWHDYPVFNCWISVFRSIRLSKKSTSLFDNYLDNYSNALGLNPKVR